MAGRQGTVRVHVWGTEAAGGQSAGGQPVTYPAVEIAAAEGIVPLPGAQQHHAVLALAPVVGFPWPPVAGAEGSGWRQGKGATAFSLDTPLGTWVLSPNPRTPSLQLRDTPAFSHPSSPALPALTISRHYSPEAPPSLGLGHMPPNTLPSITAMSPSPRQPGAISFHSRFSPIVQGALVHPDKFSLCVQVPEADPGALLVAVCGQEVLGAGQAGGLGCCARVPPPPRRPGRAPLPRSHAGGTCSSWLWTLTSRPPSPRQEFRAWIHRLAPSPK